MNRNLFALIIYFNAILLRISHGTSNPESSQPSIPNSFEHIDPSPDLDHFDTAAYSNPLHFANFHEVMSTHLQHSYRCETISLPLCKDMYYQQTRMPNFFMHETQEEAGLEAHQFYPLVQINCSEDLRFFLCSIYTPICIKGYPRFLPPCRAVCERVRAGCAPIMQHYNFPWPKRLDCSQFPMFNNTGDMLCMDRNMTEKGTVGHKNQIEMLSQTVNTMIEDDVRTNLVRLDETEAEKLYLEMLHVNHTFGHIPEEELKSRVKCTCECESIDRTTHDQLKMNQGILPWDKVNVCRMPCHVAKNTSSMVSTWLGIWTVVCIFSTFLSLLAFLTGPNQYQFPQLAIVYLAMCYCMMASGYAVRVIMGHDSVACAQNDRSTIDLGNSTRGGTNIHQTNPLHLATSERVGCALVFAFTYYFKMAGDLWWIFSNLTWFMRFGLYRDSDSIMKYSHVYHFTAWTLPSCLTALGLLTGAPEGDPFSGLCEITPRRRLVFILLRILPIFLFSLVGITFLLLGFFVKFCAKPTGKFHSFDTSTGKYRCAFFGLIYLVGNIFILLIHTHELQTVRQLELRSICECGSRSLSSRDYVFTGWKTPWWMLKVTLGRHILTLSLGTLAGFWIWSRKIPSACVRLRDSVRYSRDSSFIRNENRFLNLNLDSSKLHLMQHKTMEAFSDSSHSGDHTNLGPFRNHNTMNPSCKMENCNGIQNLDFAYFSPRYSTDRNVHRNAKLELIPTSASKSLDDLNTCPPFKTYPAFDQYLLIDKTTTKKVDYYEKAHTPRRTRKHEHLAANWSINPTPLGIVPFENSPTGNYEQYYQSVSVNAIAPLTDTLQADPNPRYAFYSRH